MILRILGRILAAAIVASSAAAATATVPNGALAPDAASASTGAISLDDNTVTAAEVRGNPLWAIPLKELSITRDRPLFSPSRRPPPPAVTVNPVAPAAPLAKAAEPERPQLTLVGTVVGDGEGYGIFLDRTSNTAIRVKTGQSHNGWVLIEIRGREAVLKKGQRTATLSLPVRSAEAPTRHEELETNLTRGRR